MERLYTPEEVAERYGTTPETLKYWRRMGRGPRSIKPGKHIRYRESALVAYEAQMEDEQAERDAERAAAVKAS